VEIVAFVGLGFGFLSIWGSLWFKLGKLTSEVKNHNLKLTKMEGQLDSLITIKGGEDGN